MTDKELEWNHLKKYGSLTAREALKLYNHFRLPAYICLWRKAGVNITDKWEYKGKKKWKRFFLEREEAERAEKEGLVSF